MDKVVSLRSTKEAALYFEEVLPVDGLSAALGLRGEPDFSYDECVPYDDDATWRVVAASLLPNHSDVDEIIRRLLAIQAAVDKCPLDDFAPSSDYNVDREDLSVLDMICRHFDVQYDIKVDPSFIINSRGRFKSMIRSVFLREISDMGFSRSPTWEGGSSIDTFTAESPNALALTISKLNLVDTEKVSWGSIVEFRKDRRSRDALRDLRLFFLDEFQRKPSEYIIDKMHQKIRAYEETVRLWRFETIQKSVSAVFSPKIVVPSSLLAGMIATIGGSPILSAVAGSGIFMANVGIELSKVYIDAKKETLDAPVRYLTKLKKI